MVTRSTETGFAPGSFDYTLLWTDNSLANLPGSTPPDIGGRPGDTLAATGKGNDPGLLLVDPIAGTVFGFPAQAGNYTGWLVLEDSAHSAETLGLDPGLDQIVLREWELSMLGAQQFTLGVKDQRTRSGPAFTVPEAGLQWVIGTTYRIAPLELDNVTTRGYQGAFEDITYTLHNAPDGWFINTDTGEFTGVFEGFPRTEKFIIKAVEKRGTSTMLEELSFAVIAAAAFKLSLFSARTRTSSEFTDPDEQLAYTVGESYRIAPLKIDMETTVVSIGKVTDITYTLEGAPDGWFVSSKTGEISGVFNQAGTYQMTLFAMDAARVERQEVQTYQFSVMLPAEFVLAEDWDPNTMGAMEARMFLDRSDLVTAAVYTLGATYEIPKPILGVQELFVHPSGEDYDAVGYRIVCSSHAFEVGTMSSSTVDREKCPGSFFVSESGAMLIKPSKRGHFNATLIGYDKRGQTAVVKEWEFAVLSDDTADPQNGPGRKDCVNGGTAEDVVLFDLKYACDCPATFVGRNCENQLQEVESSVTTNANTGAVVGGLMAMFLVCVALGIAGFKYNRHRIQMQAFDFQTELERLVASGELGDVFNGGRTAHTFTPGTKTSIPREIKRSCLTLTDIIGEGMFGEVWKGQLDESLQGGVPGYAVAIKTSKEAHGDHADELIREAQVMALVSGHVNLVSLIGVVTSGLPLLLVLSLCENGSLQACLLKGKAPGQHGTVGPPAAVEAAQMALEIACGMAHLIECHFVHRDLAARNVLLDYRHVCKIADFGLSRGTASSDRDDAGSNDEYYTSQRGQFPLRWTAPEAMETRRYSIATDVWSFGVVLLEIATSGALPYQNLDNGQVITKIMSGHRAPQPDGCHDAMYDAMLSCWATVDSERPSFEELVRSFERLLNALDQGGGPASLLATTKVPLPNTGPFKELRAADSSREGATVGGFTDGLFADDASLVKGASLLHANKGLYASDGSLKKGASLSCATEGLYASDGSLKKGARLSCATEGMYAADGSLKKGASLPCVTEGLYAADGSLKKGVSLSCATEGLYAADGSLRKGVSLSRLSPATDGAVSTSGSDHAAVGATTDLTYVRVARAEVHQNMMYESCEFDGARNGLISSVQTGGVRGSGPLYTLPASLAPSCAVSKPRIKASGGSNAKYAALSNSVPAGQGSQPLYHAPAPPRDVLQAKIEPGHLASFSREHEKGARRKQQTQSNIGLNSCIAGIGATHIKLDHGQERRGSVTAMVAQESGDEEEGVDSDNYLAVAEVSGSEDDANFSEGVLLATKPVGRAGPKVIARSPSPEKTPPEVSIRAKPSSTWKTKLKQNKARVPKPAPAAVKILESGTKANFFI
jgi:hypothetical protein